MKKITLLIACVFMVVTVSAQTLGVKAGYNGSKVSFGGNSMDMFDDLFEADVKNNMNSGFHIGVFADFELADKFVIQPELVYSSQGTTLKVEESGNWTKMKINTNYLNIPIIAKYEIFEGLSVNAGPQFGFLLGSPSMKMKWNTAGEKGSQDGGNLDRDYLNTFDFAIALGFEYDITDAIDVSARYNIGLTNLDEVEKSKSNVFQISLGYKLFSF